jgi:chromate transporter
VSSIPIPVGAEYRNDGGLSKKSLADKFDFVFMALTVIAVNRLHQSVPRTLVAVGLLAILFHWPRKERKESAGP